MILQARTGCPFEREIANLLAHLRVIRPRGRCAVSAGETPAMTDKLRHGNFALAMLRELGDMIRHAIKERQFAVFDQRPDA